MSTGAPQAEGWRPSEGDSVSGKVSALDKGWSDWTSSFYPIVTLKQEDGHEINVHCFHKVLRTRLQAIRPGIGDSLTITYHGQKDSKDGKRKVSLYTVETDKPQDSERFWGSEPQPVTPTQAPPSEPVDDEGDIPF